MSLRDVADQAGIKSSSIHYHFPTKEALSLAVASRYADRFFNAIGDPRDTSVPPHEKMQHLIAAYRRTIDDQGRVCLFLLLGSEIVHLPRAIQDEVRRFVARIVSWLSALLARFDRSDTVLVGGDVTAAARSILAAIDGALIAVRIAGNPELFDTIIGQLANSGVIPLFPPSSR